MRMKRDSKIEEITSGMPIEFYDMLHYARSLDFLDRPDYSFIKKMIGSVFFRGEF